MSAIYDAPAARVRADAAAALVAQGPAILAAIEGALPNYRLSARLAGLEQAVALHAEALALLLPGAIEAAGRVPPA